MIKVWRSYPFMMISLIAALQTIDTSFYEAASIDGANRRASFRHVTIPGIRNISIILWILMTIWSVNDFETPWLLTQDGPSNAIENLIVLAYKILSHEYRWCRCRRCFHVTDYLDDSGGDFDASENQRVGGVMRHVST